MLKPGTYRDSSIRGALLFFFFILFCTAGADPIPLYAEKNRRRETEVLQNESIYNLPVREVKLSGLKRTKERVLYPLLLIEEGGLLTQKKIETSRTNLEETNLFEEITFRYTTEPEAAEELKGVDGPEAVTVEVLLKEKRAVIPIPFFAVSDGEYAYGMAVFNANFLGLRRQLLAAALAAGGRPYATIGYIDPTLAGGKALWSLFASGGLNKSEASYPDGEIYRAFAAEAARVSAQLTLRRDKRFQPGFSLLYAHTEIDTSWEDGIDPPEDSSITAPGVSLTYEDTVFNEYFHRGVTAETRAAYAFPLGSGAESTLDGGSRIDTSVRISAALFEDQRFSLTSTAGLSEFPVPHLNELSGAGFRVLPFNRAVGRKYLAGSSSYELPLFRPEWGTLTFTAFFDGGVYEPKEMEYEVFFGPGGGLNIYLSKVAVPAMGLHFAVDVPTETFSTSVVVGMNL